MRLRLAALAVVFAACTSRTEKARDVAKEIVYIKDHRVGICYAYWKIGDDGNIDTSVLATVPCEKVERLLVNDAEAPR